LTDRLTPAVAAALACCAACAPQVDVVATQGGDGGADDGPPAPSCDPTAAGSIYFAEKGLALDRFYPAKGTFTSLGTPDCATQVITETFSMAVAPDGTVWLADTSGAGVVVDPRSTPPACTGVQFKLNPSTMTLLAFLPPLPSAVAPLYAFESGLLVVINPQSFFLLPVGPLDGTGLLDLSGTADGRLYALGQGTSQQEAAISLLNPGDASVVWTLTVPMPAGQYLRGGAYWGGSFYLFADGFYDIVNPVTGAVVGPKELAAPPIVAIASAPCLAPQ
jgi:hypothetical protein